MDALEIRFLAATYYGVFWLSLGWGTFAVIQLQRWRRRRRAQRNQ